MTDQTATRPVDPRWVTASGIVLDEIPDVIPAWLDIDVEIVWHITDLGAPPADYKWLGPRGERYRLAAIALTP